MDDSKESLPPSLKRILQDAYTFKELSENKVASRKLTISTTNYSTTFEYSTRMEQNLARYALTKLITKIHQRENIILGNSGGKLSNKPTVTTIQTDVDEYTEVFNNVTLISVGKAIFSVHLPDLKVYLVGFITNDEKKLEELITEYKNILEKDNFYKGKLLKVSDDASTFIRIPSISIEDVVLPPNLKKYYLENTVEFLVNNELHSTVNRRAILLHGEPGVGKTMLIKASIEELIKHGISCVMIGDISKKGWDNIFSFVLKYLLPCMLIVEDFDLLAYQREERITEVIGQILSSLDGIERINKPLVVVATTNRFGVLDKAAIRPCRFDRIFEIKMPGKEEITQLWKKKIGTEPPPQIFKRKDITGAHIQEIANTAELIHSRTKESYEECAKKAMNEVFEAFFIIHSKKIGFIPERRLEKDDYDDMRKRPTEEDVTQKEKKDI